GSPRRRAARRAADDVRTGDQPQDRQDPRPDNPAVGTGPGGRGDPVVDRRGFVTGALALLGAALAAEGQPTKGSSHRRPIPRFSWAFAFTRRISPRTPRARLR